MFQSFFINDEIQIKHGIKQLVKHGIKQLDNLSKHYNPKRYYEQEYQKALQKQQQSRLTVKKIPSLIVEINNTCNLDCLMCSTKQATRTKGNISLEFFEHIIKDVLKPLNQRFVAVHTVGEPLMHPKFDKILEILKKEEIRLGMTTNALLVDRYISSFYDYRDVFSNINVSIDGASKDIYEKLRKGGSFDKLMENLSLLHNFCQKGIYKIPLRIQCMISKDNLREIPLFYSIFRRYSSDFFFGFVTTHNATHDDPKYFLGSSIFPSELSERVAPCKVLNQSASILYDGKVSVCCRDYNGELIVGDINKEDLMAIWNSKKVAELRKLHMEKKTSEISFCKDCYAYPLEIGLVFNYYINYIFHRYKGKEDAFYNDKIDEFLSLLEKAASQKNWHMLKSFPD